MILTTGLTSPRQLAQELNRYPVHRSRTPAPCEICYSPAKQYIVWSCLNVKHFFCDACRKAAGEWMVG